MANLCYFMTANCKQSCIFTNLLLGQIVSNPMSSSVPVGPAALTKSSQANISQAFTSSIGNNPMALSVPAIPEQSTAAASLANISPVNTSEPSVLTHWDDNDVKLLIDGYRKHKHLFKKGRTTKKVVFEQVAKYFNASSSVSVTGDQCQRKWSKLEQYFKSVEDNNRATGRERRDWKFFDAMNECMGSSPKLNPLYCLDTSGTPSSSSTSVDSASATCSNLSSDSSDMESVSEAPSKAKKGVKRRKRKSKSSAAEMMEFLREYSEKREKSEEQKLAIMKEMNEDKKSFFSEFLNVIKNK